MSMRLVKRSGFIAVLVAFASLFATAQRTSLGAGNTAQVESDLSIPEVQRIHPEDLNQLLRLAKGKRPLVLQVGSHALFAEAHVPGAEYIGPAGLQKRVSSLPRTKSIVLYCGCCTWNRCCNIVPAFTKLKRMGFTNVKALYLADNFGISWENEGYPVQHGR